MSYLVFCADFDVTTSSILTDDSTCHDSIWQKGKIINIEDYDLSRLVFLSETPHMLPFPDYSRDGHGCPVFSEKLKKILEGNGVDNIDYYPCRVIEFENEKPISGYYAANIIGLIECLDHEKSKIRYFKDKVLGITQLAIKDDNVKGGHIFRLAELGTVILIDERFDQIFKDNTITGVKLVPPGEWDGFDGYKTRR